jgi:hypothetical protein
MWAALAKLVITTSSQSPSDAKQVQVRLNKNPKRKYESDLGLSFFTDGQDDTKSDKVAAHLSKEAVEHLNSYPLEDYNKFFDDEEDASKACDLIFRKILPAVTVQWGSWNNLKVQSEFAFSGLGQCKIHI